MFVLQLLSPPMRSRVGSLKKVPGSSRTPFPVIISGLFTVLQWTLAAAISLIRL